MLSPTYQVPVLYFTLRWHNLQGSVGLDAVYQYLVPPQYRKGLKSVGVMGGISVGVGILFEPDLVCKELMFCSIIHKLALRLFLSTRATLQMPWGRLQMHEASVPGHILSSGSAWSVIV